MRPKKKFRIKKDHGSLQAFIDGEMVGQMSIKDFCLYVLEQKNQRQNVVKEEDTYAYARRMAQG